MTRFCHGRYINGFSSKLVLIVIVIFHTVLITDSWKTVNDDTLSTPGCSIPNYNLTFTVEPESHQPACRRLIEVEKVDQDRIRFVMRKQMDSCCYSFVHSYIGSEEQEMSLSTPGCPIPNYNLSFTEEPESRQPACRHLIEVEKVDKIRFVMRKQMDSCCYSFVHSYIGSEEQEMRFTPCVPFKDQTETKIVSDVINVECDTNYETIYEDTYFLVKEVEVDRDNSTTAENTLNVLILNMEAVSRRRAYSTLPRTIQFLHRNDWFDFRGYNAIDNAMTAILTGTTIPGNSTPLWLTYQRSGYVTASNQESLVSSNITEKPTHYISPYLLADEINCTKQNADRTLDFIIDFTTTYRNKFFGVFCFKRLKDEMLANFLNKLTLTGVLYNTFVVLTSNGGDPLSSYDTFYDSRLPLSFLWTPTAFRRRFKRQFAVLKLNQWRLVSPLDFHLTLLNVLRAQSPIPSCPKCRSLFQRLSQHRYCSDAGVDKYWCACHNMTVAKLDYSSKYSLLKAISFVENETSSQATATCTTCKKSTFKNLLRIHYSQNETGVFYVVAFVMTPDVAIEVSLIKYLDDEEFFYEIYNVDVLTKRDRGVCVVNANSIYRSLCMCEANLQCFLSWILSAELLRRRANLSRFDLRGTFADVQNDQMIHFESTKRGY